MLLKISFGKQIHLYNNEITLSSVKAFVRRAFRNTVPDNFSFSYIDSEGDRITVSTQEDLSMVQSTQNGRMVKIYVEEDLKSETNVEELANNACAEEQLLKEVALNFISQIQEVAVCSALQAEEKMVKEMAGQYMTDLMERVSFGLALEEEKVMSERLFAKRRVSKLIRSKSGDRKLTKSSTVEESFTKEMIERKVSEKLNSLLPKIIEKVTKKVEARLSKHCCIRCDRTEISVEKLISKQLLNKYKTRQESSVEKMAMENPEL